MYLVHRRVPVRRQLPRSSIKSSSRLQSPGVCRGGGGGGGCRGRGGAGSGRYHQRYPVRHARYTETRVWYTSATRRSVSHRACSLVRGGRALEELLVVVVRRREIHLGTATPDNNHHTKHVRIIVGCCYLPACWSPESALMACPAAADSCLAIAPVRFTVYPWIAAVIQG